MTTLTQVRMVVAMLLRAYQLAWWLAPALMVGSVVIATLVTGADNPDASVWEHAGGPVRWVLFIVGITLTASTAPTYIAFGLTRRRLFESIGIFGGLVAAALASLLAVGYLIERVLFDLADRTPAFRDDHLFGTGTQVHLVLLEYVLLAAAYLVSGCLVGSAYYRWGGGWGTVALPLTTAPLFGVDAVIGGAGWSGLLLGQGWQGTAQVPLAAAVLVAVVLLAAGVVGLRLLTRDVPIRSRSQP